jgi:hypothetical protein
VCVSSRTTEVRIFSVLCDSSGVSWTPGNTLFAGKILRGNIELTSQDWLDVSFEAGPVVLKGIRQAAVVSQCQGGLP